MKNTILHIKKWLRQFVEDPEYKLAQIALRFVSPDRLPDRMFIKYQFRCALGYPLDLKHPKTFCEKLNWLKLYDRNPLYTTLVDKFAVKQYVADLIANQYVIPTLAVYDSADEIDLNKLPNQFVLKCTHDCGSVVICRDKKVFDLQAAKQKLDRALKINYYMNSREWPYKNVQRKIIAEEYLDSVVELNDYKFFCFHGIVKYFKVNFNKFTGMIANYYDREGNLQPFGEYGVPFSAKMQLSISKSVLEEMITKAEQLSNVSECMRVDFYEVNGEIKFGECTLYHNAGLCPLTDINKEYEWGEYILLRN